MTRAVLVALEAAVALSAFGGGIYGLSGAKGIPEEWLEGTPFDDYVVPSLVLFFVVGGSMATAAVVGIVAGREWTVLLGLVAAVVLLGWIVVQVATIGYTSFLQPLLFAVGLAILALAWLYGRGIHA